MTEPDPLIYLALRVTLNVVLIAAAVGAGRLLHGRALTSREWFFPFIAGILSAAAGPALWPWR
jgi:hypothetical protein